MLSTRLVLAVVTETSTAKIFDWLVLKNRWADSFHLWDIDFTQLERASSVIK